MATQIKNFAMSQMTIGSCSEFHNNALGLIAEITPAAIHIEALEPSYRAAVDTLASIVTVSGLISLPPNWPTQTRCATMPWELSSTS